MGKKSELIHKNRNLFNYVCQSEWTIKNVYEGGVFEENDTFSITCNNADLKITGINHFDQNGNSGAGRDISLNIVNTDHTPNWFTIDPYDLLFIHCLYMPENHQVDIHELVMRFDCRRVKKSKFEYYEAKVPLPHSNSHGRGGGGN